MSVTGLTFYGGVNEIGGNKILLEDKDTRVFLDFGKSFSRRAKLSWEISLPKNDITKEILKNEMVRRKGIFLEAIKK